MKKYYIQSNGNINYSTDEKIKCNICNNYIRYLEAVIYNPKSNELASFYNEPLAHQSCKDRERK